MNTVAILFGPTDSCRLTMQTLVKDNIIIHKDPMQVQLVVITVASARWTGLIGTLQRISYGFQPSLTYSTQFCP
jgi:hypothetical protein